MNFEGFTRVKIDNLKSKPVVPVNQEVQVKKELNKTGKIRIIRSEKIVEPEVSYQEATKQEVVFPSQYTIKKPKDKKKIDEPVDIPKEAIKFEDVKLDNNDVPIQKEVVEFRDPRKEKKIVIPELTVDKPVEVKPEVVDIQQQVQEVEQPQYRRRFLDTSYNRYDPYVRRIYTK